MFDWAFLKQIFPELLTGLWVTIKATFGGMILALILGLLLAIARRSSKRIISWPVACFVEFIRSTPLLVQLYFLFYVLPVFGPRLSPFLTGVLTLGFHYSAYTSEVYRSGIESIDKGQWQAGLALNFNRRQLFQKIILPQAIPPIIPALGNYLVAMFKDTPILSVITVLEVLQRAKLIGSETFRYFEPLTMVGILFLGLSLISACFIKQLERRLVIRHT